MSYGSLGQGMCFVLSLILPIYILFKLKKEGVTQYKKIGVFALTWGILASVLAQTGFLQNFDSLPPRLFIVLIIPLSSSLIFTFHSSTRQWLSEIPPHWLILFQSFRIPVEIFLWLLFLDHLIPIQMTFEGRNLDIISGLLALPIGYMVAKKPSKPLIIGYNLIGMGLLINIIGTALLSVPTPFRVFMNEPANTIVTTFPMVLLPAILVALAYTFHFLSLRQVFLKD